MRKLLTYSIVPLLIFFSGCNRQPDRPKAIATAFAAPLLLNLRQEIDPKSKVVTTAKHGDRLEVIQVKRRFILVRTAQGLEGWTDARQLLSPEQMTAMRELAT